jgi:hypothetical protein
VDLPSAVSERFPLSRSIRNANRGPPGDDDEPDDLPDDLAIIEAALLAPLDVDKDLDKRQEQLDL